MRLESACLFAEYAAVHLLAFVDHVVSDIISPALDRRFGIERVSLLCQQPDLALAFDIAGVCRNLQLAVTVETLPPDSQPLALRQRLQALAQGAVCFNISAASPVQAALAYDLARVRHLPLMSIEPQQDRLIWLLGGEHSTLLNGADIADGLTLEAYFGLYGSRIETLHYRLNRRNPRHEALAHDLALRAASHPKELSLLNRLCTELDEEQYSRRPLSGGEHHLRQWLEASAMVEFRPGGHMRCVDGRTRFFLAGGWLEVWLLSQLALLVPQLPISDAAVGVKISHRGVENEYDVALLCNNQLFLIECKTIAPAGPNHHGVGLENLFKLDSAASLGGLNARAMLASLYPASNSESDRAHAQQIAMLSGAQFMHAREHLREWLLS